jgi:hypothetical protein
MDKHPAESPPPAGTTPPISQAIATDAACQAAETRAVALVIWAAPHPDRFLAPSTIRGSVESNHSLREKVGVDHDSPRCRCLSDHHRPGTCRQMINAPLGSSSPVQPSELSSWLPSPPRNLWCLRGLPIQFGSLALCSDRDESALASTLHRLALTRLPPCFWRDLRDQSLNASSQPGSAMRRAVSVFVFVELLQTL